MRRVEKERTSLQPSLGENGAACELWFRPHQWVIVMNLMDTDRCIPVSQVSDCTNGSILGLYQAYNDRKVRSICRYLYELFLLTLYSSPDGRQSTKLKHCFNLAFIAEVVNEYYQVITVFTRWWLSALAVIYYVN